MATNRVSIIKRYTHVNGIVKRILECGHVQSEPRGGKAAKATFVRSCHACAEVEREKEREKDLAENPPPDLDKTVEVPVFPIPKSAGL